MWEVPREGELGVGRASGAWKARTGPLARFRERKLWVFEVLLFSRIEHGTFLADDFLSRHSGRTEKVMNIPPFR